LSGRLSGSIVKCRKLAFCGRHGGVDTMKVHKLGANAKPRHSAAGVIVFVSQVNVIKSA
jgi:hypothetical protein